VLHKAIGGKGFTEFLDLLRTILLRTKALSVEAHDLSKVAEVAEKERITFYDASYITVAKVRNLTLVTEDTRLAKAASDHTKTTSGKDLRF
jgi:predicted nucleic acid-binding protein